MIQQPKISKYFIQLDKNEVSSKHNVTKEKKNQISLSTVAYTNLLFYINENINSSHNESIIKYCVDHYTKEDVNSAKNCLMYNYEKLISSIDSNVMADLMTTRRDSTRRPAHEITLDDMCNALTSLDADGKRLDIRPLDENGAVAVNPEALNEQAMLLRFKIIEDRLTIIEKENSELKATSFRDKDNIKKLEADIIKLQNINKDLL